jgi:hypothetical protein
MLTGKAQIDTREAPLPQLTAALGGRVRTLHAAHLASRRHLLVAGALLGFGQALALAGGLLLKGPAFAGRLLVLHTVTVVFHTIHSTLSRPEGRQRRVKVTVSHAAGAAAGRRVINGCTEYSCPAHGSPSRCATPTLLRSNAPVRGAVMQLAESLQPGQHARNAQTGAIHAYCAF